MTARGMQAVDYMSIVSTMIAAIPMVKLACWWSHPFHVGCLSQWRTTRLSDWIEITPPCFKIFYGDYRIKICGRLMLCCAVHYHGLCRQRDRLGGIMPRPSGTGSLEQPSNQNSLQHSEDRGPDGCFSLFFTVLSS